MGMNTQLLKSYIVKHDRTQAMLAESMGISLSTLNAKINESVGREFNQAEISFIKNRYNLTAEEVIEIFFSSKVSLIDTNEVS